MPEDSIAQELGDDPGTDREDERDGILAPGDDAPIAAGPATEPPAGTETETDGENTGDEVDVAKSPDAIQREIEATRAELASTIDAIADRVSPKKAATRGVQAAKAKAAAALGGDKGGPAEAQPAPKAAAPTAPAPKAAAPTAPAPVAPASRVDPPATALSPAPKADVLTPAVDEEKAVRAPTPKPPGSITTVPLPPAPAAPKPVDNWPGPPKARRLRTDRVLYSVGVVATGVALFVMLRHRRK